MSQKQTSRRPTGSASLSFVDYLEKALHDAPPKQKGARTRERLKIATAAMLEEKGYHAMRVTDITRTAGVADGLFYSYFKDKKEASLTALSAFLGEFADDVAPPEAVGAPFASIQAANRRWFAICRANAGLMRCVLQLGDDDPDFAEFVHSTTRKTYLRVARSMPSADGNTESTRLLAIYLMGSMMDEIVRKLIVFPDREFLKLLPPADTDNALADAASLVWVRLFDPTATPPADLGSLPAELATMIWGPSDLGTGVAR